MEDIIISESIISGLAAQKGITEAQLTAWITANMTAIVMVRGYIEQIGVTTPTGVENNADPAGPMDPTTAANILDLLAYVGMLTRIDRTP